MNDRWGHFFSADSVLDIPQTGSRMDAFSVKFLDGAYFLYDTKLNAWTFHHGLKDNGHQF
jgi:phage baseplate assembly protein gpV